MDKKIVILMSWYSVAVAAQLTATLSIKDLSIFNDYYPVKCRNYVFKKSLQWINKTETSVRQVSLYRRLEI